MKNECDIVKDLLFSYNDGVLSETSKNFVEKHLKDCENCNNALKEIRQENGKIEQKKEIDAFKGVRKKISKRNNVIISIGIIILLIIIIFNVLVFVNYNNMITTIQISLQKDITEEQLADIENVIKENASGVEIEYISEDYQLRMLQNWLEEDAHILDNYKGGEDSPFKPSLTIKVKEKNDTQKVVKAIKNMPGIYKILNYEDQNPYILFLSKLLYS